MKTIKLITSILLLSVSNMLVAQIQIEHKKINEPMEAETINTTIRPILDSAVHDWTNGLRDDTALYFSSGTNRSGSGDSIRAIYFIHGLGGDETSWGATYNAHVNEFRYKPYKIDYYGNQHSFLNATDEAHTDMGVKFSSYKINYPSRFDTISKPYAIGHSLGGLVARDMDMKHDSLDLIDRTLNPGNRRFWGLVTFGTSHAGAHIVGNQQELAQLGSDLAGKIITANLSPIIDNMIGNLPFVAQTFIGTSALSSAPSKIGAYFGDSLGAKILTQFTKDQTDPIGKQFTPTSTYLVDTLNQYINPKLAKALFWGEEEDPILWRMAYYLVNGPNTFSTFGANEDGKLATTMEKMRVDAKAWSDVYRGHANWHRSQASKWWNVCRWCGKSNSHMQRYGVTSAISRDLKALEEELSKVNLKYKAIIGAIDENNFRIDTIYIGCKENITVNIYKRSNNQLLQTNYYSKRSRSLSLCGTTTTRTVNSWMFRIEYITDYVHQYRYLKRLIESPSDATVLASSAIAFPGCLDNNKNFMGPVPLSGGGMSSGRVNHLQMRNCSETDAALRKIYEGDGLNMPAFFRLHKW